MNDLLKGLKERVGDGPKRRAFLRSLATDVMRKSLTENILSGGRPPFAPLAPFTIAMKTQRGQPLMPGIATGEMFNSLIPGLKGNVLKVGPDSVEYGTSDWKAPLFHGGVPENNQPARPFVMFQPQDITDMANRYRAYLLTGATL